MGKRSGPNRRILVVRGRRLDVCGLARRFEPSRCRSRAAGARQTRRPLSARLVALSSCLTFLAALALSGLAVSRGPTGFVPDDPRRHLPVTGAANHTVDEFFLAAGAR